MIALIGAFLSRNAGSLLIVGGLFLGIVGIFGFGYLKGKEAGRVEQLKDSVTAYETREGIDNDTNALARAAVCRRLGGLPEQCDELRGMEEAPASE